MVLAMVLGALHRCEVLGLRPADLRIGERRVFIGEGKGGQDVGAGRRDDVDQQHTGDRGGVGRLRLRLSPC
ncbi:hypothetical protein M6B22_18960 [Jatrophihabitans cynanchi]|jgi:hypothetical protein|uniref:Tyr recombinase domain-containing protein n=1 Tax=Jatrophihabitans cynanchi TaxID=2944128 RepID=A0ABY7JVL1_9ACTN|nr:hypothetical protein [Jatrophihabitans sp. SB3-54]WAX56589.1 hypothetical protein M6B22_18960 [Jatrophihabitans sp. SB3-54]